MEKRKVKVARFHDAIQLIGYTNTSGGVITSAHEKDFPDMYKTDVGIFIPVKDGLEVFVSLANVPYALIYQEPIKEETTKKAK